MNLKYNIGLKKEYKVYISPEAGVINNSSTASGILIDFQASFITSEIITESLPEGILTGKGSLSASLNSTTTLLGFCFLSGQISGATFGKSKSNSNLIGVALIYGISNVVSDPTTGTLYGTSLGISLGSTTVIGILNSLGKLDGVINGDSGVYGIMSHKITSSSNGATTVTGTLSGIGVLLSSSNGIATVIGSILANGIMVGLSNGSASVIGILLGKVQTLAISESSASVLGILSAIGNLNGESETDVTVSLNNGSSIGLLSSSINTSSSVEGVMFYLLANSNSITNVIGNMNAIGYIEGISQNSTLVQGTFLNPLDGVANNFSIVIGTLTANGNLSGIINGITITNAFISDLKFIEGITNGSTTVTGILTGTSNLIGIIKCYAQTAGTLIGPFYPIVQISGIINGSSNVRGYLMNKNFTKNGCCYEVVYKKPIHYLVKYVDKKYYVNYRCKK